MTNTLSLDIKTFLQKDTTKNFLMTAQMFTDLLEKKDIPKDKFLKEAHTILIDLYLKGHQLEQIDLKYSDADTEFEKSDDELFKNQNQALIALLGDEAFYREIFDPINDKEEEPVQGWLVDAFADIYRDLKIELEKIKIGTDEAIEDAIWQMKWSFFNHWGRHCVSAIRALHFLYYDGKDVM